MLKEILSNKIETVLITFCLAFTVYNYEIIRENQLNIATIEPKVMKNDADIYILENAKNGPPSAGKNIDMLLIDKFIVVRQMPELEPRY